ncbi:MAG: hypothetical protein L6R40_006160 [Gallowayella cf. fulva]|nr:MAG: hypothetical protein L6R40_006160 [Xanthomendoza cf. fulva]
MLDNLRPSPKYIQVDSQASSRTALAIDDSRQTVASEPAKAAIETGWLPTARRCILHAAPIAVTVWMLVYNGRGVYWRDAGFRHQNPILQALQYLAKVHELLMAASLAEIALNRTHYELCASDGLPLGLVTAAYQVSSISYLITPEFYKNCRIPLSIKGLYSRLSLLSLFVIIFLLTSVLGPSSAVAMIPRLDWWDHTNPYPEGPERAFMRYKYSDLWPTSITKELIHPGCADPDSADAEYCPYSGYEMTSNWIGAHQNQGQAPNLTVPNHGGVTRHLASTYNGTKSAGWTITSTVGYKEAWDLGAFWQYASERNGTIAQLGRPRIAPAFLDAAPIKKPVVQVECAAQYSWSSQISLPRRHLQDPNNPFTSRAPWTIPSSTLRSHAGFQNLFPNATNGSQEHQGQLPTSFAWIDTSSSVDSPSIGAIFGVNTPNTSIALIPCSIAAYWTPSSTYLDPKSDLVIQEDHPDPLEQAHLWTPITTISTDWADTMNPNFTDDNGEMTTYIQHMIQRYNNNSSSPVIFAEPGYGQESIPWRLSVALGLYLTEALARVQSTFWNGTVLCHTDSETGRRSEKVYILGNLNADDPRWWPPETDFVTFALQMGWPELTFSIRRYGRCWASCISLSWPVELAV